MNADLVLEGGGVKGIGLVGAVSVLEERGYSFPRIAGTSAGAIVGALAAAGYSGAELRDVMDSVDYTRFADRGLIDVGPLGMALSLIFERGIYEGAYLKDWLGEHLAGKGVRTFRDLRLPADPDGTLEEHQRYRLVVMAADLSRGALVRLPWDYERSYGLEPDEQPVVDAVRASMSIPFFYEPAKLRSARSGETSYLVDGGVLSNFPVAVFDRTDANPPRWPTFGIKLSARPDANQVPNRIDDTLGFAKALVATMMSGHDQMHIDDPCVQQRTIFVDTLRVQATDFDLAPATRRTLYENGRRAAEVFLATWSFDEHIASCRS